MGWPTVTDTQLDDSINNMTDRHIGRRDMTVRHTGSSDMTLRHIGRSDMTIVTQERVT